MGTRIRAACPSCNEVTLAPAEVTLLICLNVETLSTYCFRCPSCRCVVEKPADVHVRNTLGGEVPRRSWRAWRASELEPHPAGDDPLTLDDALEFGLALGHVTDIAGAARSVA